MRRLDDAAIRAANLMQARQPRADFTIAQLPGGGNALPTDVLPVFRNGQTYQLPVSGVASGLGPGSITSILLAPANQLTQMGWFAVKDFGAKGDGLTDDTAAIQATIAAAQLAGGGIVLFAAGTYIQSATLSITTSHIGLVGAGMNLTILLQKNANGSGVSFAGTPTAALANVYISGISLNAAGAATGAILGSYSNFGLSLYHTTLSRCDNMQISGFYTGVVMQQATNTLVSRIFCTFNPNAAGTTNGAVGFSLNGNTTSGGLSGGNASSMFRDCGVDFSPAVGGYANANVNSIGFRIFGAYCGDLFFDACGVSYAYTAYAVDFSTVVANADGNGDIHFSKCTCDVITNAGWNVSSISAAPIDNLSMVNIIDCWAAPYASAATPFGIYVLNVRGVLVQSTQCITSTPLSAANQIGVYVQTSANVMIESSQFVGQKNGVVAAGGTDMQISGNRFYSAAGSPSTGYVSVIAGSRVGVANNSFDGYSSGAAIQFDNASSYCTALGNTIHQANVPNPAIVQGTGTGHQVENNVIS